MFIRTEVIVGATLQTVEGENLISYQSSSEVRGIAQILLLPLLPWTLTHPIEDEVCAAAMRSSLSALATDFAHLQSHASSESTQSAAGPETTD